MKHVFGNILDVTSGVIVQQVNAQGVMGSGLARAIRDRYPVVFEKYSQEFLPRQADQGRQYLGRIQLIDVSPTLKIANVVGQQFYGRDGHRYTSYDALATALSNLKVRLDSLSIGDSRVHHSFLGCGLGGGDWRIVSAIIESTLGQNTTCWDDSVNT
jgi:O-acetyl-ADP-ribose deacetylase (regulator of RNase III)